MEFGSLFVSDDYLEPLSAQGCAAPGQGWARIPDVAAPLYVKGHSWGEFVFDFEYAQAYAAAGLDYYPKLVCAVPFTPVPGPRLLGLDGPALRDLVGVHDASSAHVLFLPEDEARLLAADGWWQRDGLRFVWHHRGYTDFEDFLAALASKKRKNIRAERRRVGELGLDIRWQAAAEIDPRDWPVVFELYASTYHMRGQAPYLNQACLQAWARGLGDALQFCMARKHGELLAMAWFLDDGRHLYGRHWGSAVEADGLHFELCYYQGIERAIARGLSLFDAGVQGGHRLLRGFEPMLTRSMHWFADPRFHRAIGAHLARERQLMARQFAELSGRTAFARV